MMIIIIPVRAAGAARAACRLIGRAEIHMKTSHQIVYLVSYLI